MTHITESHLSVSLELFEEFESNVRTYCRNFPTIFTKAKGHTLWDETGREYIDFFLARERLITGITTRVYSSV